MARVSQKVIYIDGFAGPGVYTKGEFGSPIIALNCLINHSQDLCNQTKTEFIFLFIESDEMRAGILKEVIATVFPKTPNNVKIYVKHANFEREMEGILDELEKNQANLAPTFAFIDPFGYSGLPLHLIKRILAYPQCEVFINFAYNSINRFLDMVDTRQDLLDNLFGTTEWQQIRDIEDPDEKNSKLTTLYMQRLQTSSKFVTSFEMLNSTNNIAYYLYFGTNHIRGFEQMKQAMWKVDPRGSYRFSDTTDAGTKYLLSFGGDTRLHDQAEAIFSQFKGRTASDSQIKYFCMAHPVFPTLWKGSLKILEDEGKLTVTTPRKRKGTFPNGCVICFNAN